MSYNSLGVSLIPTWTDRSTWLGLEYLSVEQVYFANKVLLPEHALQGKSHLYIPFLGIARPQS